MIQVEVQIWNKRWWQVFKRQNSPEAAPWYTEYQKLEHLEHGVRKISEHVGCKFPKPPRAQGTWYKRHENHERKEGGHIKKEMCETQQHVWHKAQEAKEPLYQTLFTARFLCQIIIFIYRALSEINCYLRPKSSFLPWCRYHISNQRKFEKFNRAEWDN